MGKYSEHSAFPCMSMMRPGLNAPIKQRHSDIDEFSCWDIGIENILKIYHWLPAAVMSRWRHYEAQNPLQALKVKIASWWGAKLFELHMMSRWRHHEAQNSLSCNQDSVKIASRWGAKFFLQQCMSR